jgi:hypothetical protein
MPKRLSGFSSDHMLAVIDFRACVELATKSRDDIAIISWKEGKQLLMNANIRSSAGIIKQVPIIPDGYFRLKHGEKEFHYFLEIDRGTSDLKRIAEKCRGYLNIWQDKIALVRFGVRAFRVLYITTAEKRLSKMLAELQKLKSNHQRTDLIMMTCFKRYSLAKSASLVESIWNSIDDNGDIREIGLLPDITPQSSRQRAENHHCAVQNPIPVNGTPGPGG